MFLRRGKAAALDILRLQQLCMVWLFFQLQRRLPPGIPPSMPPTLNPPSLQPRCSITRREEEGKEEGHRLCRGTRRRELWSSVRGEAEFHPSKENVGLFLRPDCNSDSIYHGFCGAAGLRRRREHIQRGPRRAACRGRGVDGCTGCRRQCSSSVAAAAVA